MPLGCLVDNQGSRDGAVVRALAPHPSLPCRLGLIPGVDATCGLSLLLVLIPALKPTFPKSNLTRTESHSVDLLLKFLICLFINLPDLL